MRWTSLPNQLITKPIKTLYGDIQKFRKTLPAAAFAATTLIAFAAQADPVYLIATVSVTDWEKHRNDYPAVAVPGILNADGEILVGATKVAVVEREYPLNWTVVVKFPSAETANGFFGSPEDQAVISMRHAASNTETSVLMVAPQFVSLTQ